MATILIIDDDQQIRGMVREALESEGHRVLESVNGVEGAELYRSCQADLVICDLVLPEKSGLTMMRELMQDYPTLKCITMSGFTGSLGFTSLEFTKKLGAHWSLAKPFELSEMLRVVREALHSTKPTPAVCS